MRRATGHHLSVKPVPWLIPPVVFGSQRLLELLSRVLVPLERVLHPGVTSVHGSVSALLLCLSLSFTAQTC